MNPENLSEKVHKLFMYCLCNDSEKNNGIIIKGINCSIALHSKRIEEKKSEIQFIINMMDPKFKEGYSFMGLCYDKDNNLWTGLQTIMQELMFLALGSKLGSYVTEDRSLWAILPGGMPYLFLDIKEESV